jgi:membrane-associated phospholipid phosphatase
MNNLKIVFYLICISSPALYAQFNDAPSNNNFNSTSIYENMKSDAVIFYNVGLNFIQSPLHFDKTDFILTGAILGFTAASLPLDQPMRTNIAKVHGKTLDKVTNIGEKFGNAKYGTILSGALYVGGLISGDNYTRQTGQMLAEAMLPNGLVSTGTKMMFGRTRPFVDKGSYSMEMFEFETEFEETSLPSGHTSTAFTIATVLSNRIDNTYASIALYSMASLTAFQRIYVDKHWYSDTILGAALGTVIG